VTTAVPTKPEHIEDVLGPNGLDNKAKEVLRSYVQDSLTNGVQDRISEGVQAAMADYLRSNPDVKPSRPNFAPDAKKGAGYNNRAPGAKVDELFNGDTPAEVAGQFLRNTWHRARGDEAASVQAKLHDIRNAFGSTVPADGGFLIPETLRSELLRVALENSIVRSRARVVPMETLTVPFPTLDSTSNASNVYGGLTAYWTEEAGALTSSSATFGRVKLEAKKLTAYSEVPNELFQDSLISLEAFISQAFPEALAWFEDIAFIRGTGVGEPLGWNTSGNTAKVDVSKETGQVATTLVWENLVKMFARLLPTSMGKAVWIANIDTFPELATMALSVGTGGSAIWLNNGVEGPPARILGLPVVFTEKMETLGTAGDIALVDLSYYLIGDRQTLQSDTSPHYKFANDQTAMRFIQRVDGTPWIKTAITPNKGSNTLSPFVRLATR
jgi:HK97 family phage major capsid protein